MTYTPNFADYDPISPPGNWAPANRATQDVSTERKVVGFFKAIETKFGGSATGWSVRVIETGNTWECGKKNTDGTYVLKLIADASLLTAADPDGLLLSTHINDQDAHGLQLLTDRLVVNETFRATVTSRDFKRNPKLIDRFLLDGSNLGIAEMGGTWGGSPTFQPKVLNGKAVSKDQTALSTNYSSYIDLKVSDVWITQTMDFSQVSSQWTNGVSLRHNGLSTGSDSILVQFSAGTTQPNVRIYTLIGAATTQIGPIVYFTASQFSAADVVEVIAYGPLISVYLNGVLLLSVSITACLTNTYHGFRIAGYCTCDSITVDEISKSTFAYIASAPQITVDQVNTRLTYREIFGTQNVVVRTLDKFNRADSTPSTLANPEIGGAYLGVGGDTFRAATISNTLQSYTPTTAAVGWALQAGYSGEAIVRARVDLTTVGGVARPTLNSNGSGSTTSVFADFRNDPTYGLSILLYKVVANVTTALTGVISLTGATGVAEFTRQNGILYAAWNGVIVATIAEATNGGDKAGIGIIKTAIVDNLVIKEII